MPLSLFMQLADRVFVRDLMSPLRNPLTPSMTAADAMELLERGPVLDSSLRSLVLEGNRVVGWTEYEFLRDRRDLADDAVSGRVGNGLAIAPDDIVTADTTSRRLLQMFAERSTEFWFVIEGTSFVGTVDFRDLFKPPFRACLFALAMEVEQAILRKLLGSAGDAWRMLSESRRRSAQENYRRSHRRFWWWDGNALTFRISSQADEQILEWEQRLSAAQRAIASSSLFTRHFPNSSAAARHSVL